MHCGLKPFETAVPNKGTDPQGVTGIGSISPDSWWRQPGMIGLLAGGIILIGLHLAVLALSPGLGYGGDRGSWAVLALVGLEVGAGGIYFLAMRTCVGHSSGTRLLVWILVVGALIRALMFFSTPILEDDFYRYLWDGAVLARGFNPYKYSPQSILNGFDSTGMIPDALLHLARESGEIIRRINHPYLSTIYPPVSQAAFTLAYWLSPFSLTAWRLVLLGFDLATLCLLIPVLRVLKLPLSWLAVYWWNPLLVKEVINSGHMDLVALPLVLGAVLYSLHDRPLGALVCLAGAIGVKIWPLVLLPLVLRPLISSPRRLGFGLILFGLLTGILFLPVLVVGWVDHSGFLAYGQRWEMNDALFKLFHGGTWLILQAVDLQNYAQFAARLLAVGLIALWVTWLVRSPIRDGQDFSQRCLLAVAAVFLLSPTQFPCYYVWLIPLLAIRPQASLLLLTVLLPLYYLRFFFLSRGQAAVFDYGIVWLEYLPVWILLGWEWRANSRPVFQKGTGYES